MAGGTFNRLSGKVRPGTYINFETTEQNVIGVSERGTVLLPLADFPYGPAKEFITINNASPDEHYAELGYSVYDDPMLLVKEALKEAKTVIVYILNSGGAKATKTQSGITATAKYAGARGNDLKFDCVANGEKDADEHPYFDVTVYLGDAIVEEFENLLTIGDLKAVESEWLTFTGTDSTALAAFAAASLAGGTNGSYDNAAFTTFLDSAELMNWNTMALPIDSADLRAAVITKIKYLREDVGKYRAAVISGQAADYKGIINVTNGYKLDDGTEVNAVKATAWVAGADAGAAQTESLTYKSVSGASDIIGLKNHAQAVAAINNGEFFFSFNEKGEVAVEYDINSLTTFGKEAKTWRKNRVRRVLDSIGESIMLNFPPNKYSNDDKGWDAMEGIGKAILKLYYDVGAITNVYYDSDFRVDRSASKGDECYVNVGIQPVDSAEKLFFTVRTR